MKYLSVGEEFVGYCVIRRKELKYKKSGEPYLKLEVGDTSGRLSAKSWKNAETLFERLKTGQIVKIRGQIQWYQNFKELNILQIRRIRPDEADSCQDLLPRSRKDISGLLQKFQTHLDSITCPYLMKLLTLVFEDGFPVEEYVKMPSGKLWHHNYLYGNLEHLVCLMDITDAICMHYRQLDGELLKTAVIIHNVGVPTEFSRDGFIDYTTSGRLLGHVYLALSRVHEKIDEIENFPDRLKLHLLHIISSQNSFCNDDPGVKAMSLEAIVFSLMKFMDMQVNAAERILHYDKLPGSEWTTFNRLFKRFLYGGQKLKNEGADESEEENITAPVEE
ncbi:MAG: hypothetical protein JXL67_05830 [Calditrichaeota bacterium]|nr:hypothetical protein [Calditrichota bacterium]